MKITIKKEFVFDLAEEKRRLKRCFKGKQLARQMAIVNAFESRDFQKCVELFDKLPYDKKFSEKEYVGLYFNFLKECGYNDYVIQPEK